MREDFCYGVSLARPLLHGKVSKMIISNSVILWNHVQSVVTWNHWKKCLF